MLPRNINKNPPAHSPFLGLVPVKDNGNVKIALAKVFPSSPTNQTRIACSCCRAFCRSVPYPLRTFSYPRVPWAAANISAVIPL